MNFKILIADRLYSDYKCININTEEIVDVSIENLFEKKIFNNDIMELTDNSI